MTKKRALITGVTGQDGAYLAELLLQKGYEVHGIKRRASLFNTDRIDHLSISIPTRPIRHSVCTMATSRTRPAWFVSSARCSRTRSTISRRRAMWPFRSRNRNTPPIRTPWHAAPARSHSHCRPGEQDSLLPGLDLRIVRLVQEIPQKETTPFYPRSPYAVAKLYAYWITVNYREAYGMYACNGILFNPESPVRGETFVTRKITRALARIHLGLQDRSILGNLDALRDWGHARDYVEMQWMMLQQDKPEDFVIATGKQYSVRDFVNHAAAEIGITVRWEGSGVREKVLTKPPANASFRWTPLFPAVGSRDPARRSLQGKAEAWLGAEDVVRGAGQEMMQEDLESAKRDELIKQHGFRYYARHE